MDITTFANICKIEESKCAKVLDSLGYDFSMPFYETMATPLKDALTTAGALLFPALAAIEALKKESGIGVAAPAATVPAPSAAPALAAPIQVTVVSDKAPADMRDHELLTALAASPNDREVIKVMEQRGLMVVAVDGVLSAHLTTDMWNSIIPPEPEDEFWKAVGNRIVNPGDLGRAMVLLCPVTLGVLRDGVHTKTHTVWGTDIEDLTAARWASLAQKLGSGDVIAQHAAWGERKSALKAEFAEKCKQDPNLRASVRAQVEQLHARRRSSSPATRKVVRGGTATVNDSEGRLSALDQANQAQQALTDKILDTLKSLLRSEFDLLVFRLGVDTAYVRSNVSQFERASDVIHYMLPRGRISELTLAITQHLGSDRWLRASTPQH